jgi:hypothetical protein
LREQLFRFGHFLARFMRAAASRIAYASDRLSYFMRVGRYSDMTRDERRKLAVGPGALDGLAVGPTGPAAAPPSGSGERAAATRPQLRAKRDLLALLGFGPKSSDDEVDWRRHTDESASCLAEPRPDQAECACCYAMASISMLEWLYCRHQQRAAANDAGQSPRQPQPIGRFSTQYLVDCGRPFELAGCEDGGARGVTNFVQWAGLVPEAQMPFEGDERECPADATDEIEATVGDGGGRSKTVAVRRHKSALVPKSVRMSVVPVGEWLAELRKQPLLVYARLPEDSLEYGGGIYEPNQCDPELGHFMLLVGWRYDQKRRLAYWLLANSYGPDYGESGYLRVRAESPNKQRKSDYETNCLYSALKLGAEF